MEDNYNSSDFTSIMFDELGSNNQNNLEILLGNNNYSETNDNIQNIIENPITTTNNNSNNKINNFEKAKYSQNSLDEENNKYYWGINDDKIKIEINNNTNQSNEDPIEKIEKKLKS